MMNIGGVESVGKSMLFIANILPIADVSYPTHKPLANAQTIYHKQLSCFQLSMLNVSSLHYMYISGLIFITLTCYKNYLLIKIYNIMKIYFFSLLDYNGQEVVASKKFYGSAKHAAFKASKIVDAIPAVGGFQIHKRFVSPHEVARKFSH
jgi:hypothetical protein